MLFRVIRKNPLSDGTEATTEWTKVLKKSFSSWLENHQQPLIRITSNAQITVGDIQEGMHKRKKAHDPKLVFNLLNQNCRMRLLNGKRCGCKERLERDLQKNKKGFRVTLSAVGMSAGKRFPATAHWTQTSWDAIFVKSKKLFLGQSVYDYLVIRSFNYKNIVKEKEIFCTVNWR